MVQPSVLTYCTTCGRPVDECTCDPVAPAPPPRRRRAVPILAAVATVAVLAWGIHVEVVDRGLRDDLRAAQSALARVRDAPSRLDAGEAGLNGLSRRISAIEQAQAATPKVAEVAATVSRSVFTVVAGQAEGSAWVIATNPTRLVTNFHVVEDVWNARGRSVELRQEDRTYPATIIEVSAAVDVAVVQMDEREPALPLASGRPQVGDAVLVVGTPLGLGGTVSSGIVSAYRVDQGVEYLQFSAPISPGNSGGPVVNDHGEVVGITVAKFIGEGAEGLSFAIPIDRACAVLREC